MFSRRAGMNLQLARRLFWSFVPVRRAQACSQLLFQDGNVGSGAIIGAPRTLPRHIGIGDDVDLVAQVIEGQQAIEEHQHAVGQQKIVLRLLADILQLPDCVVGEIPHRACGEWRQSRHDRRTMLAQQFLNHLDGAARASFLAFAALHHDVSALRSHLHVRAGSQKGVAANLLATLHRLQQKSIRLVGSNCEKGGDRRQQVCRDRLHHRHQCGFAGEA
jgi:hypothetical protein